MAPKKKECDIDIDFDDNKYKYDSLIPKSPHRLKIYTKIQEILTKYNKYNLHNNEIQKMSLNVERGLFNKAIENNKSSEWDAMIKYRYTTNAVRIFTNLNPESYLKNTQLIERFLKKEFTEFELVNFGPDKLFPEKYSERISAIKESEPKIVDKKDIPDGMHRCGVCKTYKTTHYQLQTRSADEPLTTFVRCHICDKNWKY